MGNDVIVNLLLQNTRFRSAYSDKTTTDIQYGWSNTTKIKIISGYQVSQTIF
jgi:hypothetical protein